MTYLIFISVALSGALLYLLSSNSANTEGFSIDYYSLLGLTGLLASALMGLVGYQLWRLRNKLKNKVFGAKLTLRLVLFFTLIGVLPGVLIYVVSRVSSRGLTCASRRLWRGGSTSAEAALTTA
jgi:nitrogen fixation/metabolism regulation signal transduction histidine kinase